MTALTKEWIEKAEGDFNTALRELRARKKTNYDGVCFHCQQCAEKYLKAFLQEQKHRFSKIHDLIELVELCLLYDGTFELQRNMLKDLTKYAVEFRYPGESAIKKDAQAAVQRMKSVRAFVRQRLGLRA